MRKILSTMLLVVLPSCAHGWTGPYVANNRQDGRLSSYHKTNISGNDRIDLFYENEERFPTLFYREGSPAGFTRPSEPVIVLGLIDYVHSVFSMADGRPAVLIYHSNKDNSGYSLRIKSANGWVSESTPLSGRVTLETYLHEPEGPSHFVYSNQGKRFYVNYDGSGAWSEPLPVGLNYGITGMYTENGYTFVLRYNRENSTVISYKLQGGTFVQHRIFPSFPEKYAVYENAYYREVDGTEHIVHRSTSSGGIWTKSPTGTWSATSFGPNTEYAKLYPSPDGAICVVGLGDTSRDDTAFFRYTGKGWTFFGSFPGNRSYRTVLRDSLGYFYLFDGFADDIRWYTNQIDIYAPPPPTNIEIISGDKTATIKWTNPEIHDFRGSVLVANASHYPEGQDDGQVILREEQPLPGIRRTALHSPLVNGQRYYYSVFAYDTSGNYSLPLTGTATPEALRVGAAKLLLDGASVSLSDKVVIANFPLQGFLYISEGDRSSGIRVETLNNVVASGDVVTVAGSMNTRKQNGMDSERSIVGGSITEVGNSKVVVKPLTFTANNLGGAGFGGFATGVNNGYGLNNIGLLVSCTGRVTDVAGSLFWIDDGSGVQDSPGRVGVTVRYPTSPAPVAINDIVTVEGVLTGSIPIGMTKNRRHIQMQSPEYLNIQN